MMSEPYDTVRKFQQGLGPLIKPREQTNYIRRILALHIKTYIRDGSVKQPLALADAAHDSQTLPGHGSNGVYEEYTRAVNAHVTARNDFEASMQRTATPDRSRQPSSEKRSETYLNNQLVVLHLRQKRQRLATIQQYLDQLLEQPAASSDYLNLERIFEGITPLPCIPQEVVGSLAAESHQSRPGTGSQPIHIEKTVLKAKLRLEQEEVLLQEAKSRYQDRPNIFSNAARLAALGATRGELIAWIEAELSVASAEDAGHEAEQDAHGSAAAETNPSVVNASLSEIKVKYSQYLTRRRHLLSLVARDVGVLTPPELKPAVQSSEVAPQIPAPSVDHLLTPCINALISLSNTQKSLIAEKSHISTTLERCTDETCQMLGHLAEESQLLPKYPLKDSLRRRSRAMDELTVKTSEKADLSTRIQPWVFAVDAAKIAHLESVAETIEGGQMALEHAITVLADVETLLGIANQVMDTSEKSEDADDDVWLGTEKPLGQGTRKYTEAGRVRTTKGDIWSTLHGNLGLIGHDDAS